MIVASEIQITSYCVLLNHLHLVPFPLPAPVSASVDSIHMLKHCIVVVVVDVELIINNIGIYQMTISVDMYVAT